MIRETYSRDYPRDDSHVHTFGGQSLSHAHEHSGAHGYYEHSEDAGSTAIHADPWSPTFGDPAGRDFMRAVFTYEDEHEVPDSYLDRVDGHWYVCRYDRTAPQVHALDCTTCRS